MYTREIQAPRASPIENGKPLAGTWTRAFDEVDLLSIHRPYSLPFPRWIRDWRIKEWQSFMVQDERYFLIALLVNYKSFRWAQVCVYDKTTKERLWFKKALPLSGWHLPQGLANASIESRSYGFFFRIHDWLDANTIRVDIDIGATKKRPSFTAHLHYNLSKKTVTPLAVSLLFADQRSMYAYKALAAVRGDMVFAGHHTSLNPDKTTGLFCDFKGFYPYRMQASWCTAFGLDAQNRRIGFNIAENQARETFKNTENALWVDGQLTPLPPVRITMPKGIESPWVIQDVEGMVDLTFTPQEPIWNAVNLIITRAEYDTPLGYYNGMLVNAAGDRIPVHNLWGMGEKLYLRV
jgi:hypothetical protein